jgi:hypothetical protein
MFHYFATLERIEIPQNIEIIYTMDFFCCASLYEVVFGAESHLREIRGFQRCSRLSQIAIPSSVETIGTVAFKDCLGIRVVVFASENNIVKCDGFGGCGSISQVFESPMCWTAGGCRLWAQYVADSMIKWRCRTYLLFDSAECFGRR